MRSNRLAIGMGLIAALALGLPAMAPAAPKGGPLSLRNSFRIGTSGVLCTAQSRLVSPNLVNMFDRGYRIVCRDAASPVGRLNALRNNGGDPVARVIANSDNKIDCQAPVAAQIEGLSGALLHECTDPTNQLSYKVYALKKGNVTYTALGLGGYDSALQLGLRTLVADRIVKGEVQVATTSAGDADVRTSGAVAISCRRPPGSWAKRAGRSLFAQQ